MTDAARPTAIDLFAGAGGLALGFEQAGFDVLTAVEYDAVHAGVHAFNFPHTKVLCADVSKLKPLDLLEAADEGWCLHGRRGRFDRKIDVIFGGPPCQGFSTIGKRLIEDERNQLVFHFYRLIAEVRPRYFVMENVPGMAQGGHSGILSQLIDDFNKAGYLVTMPPRILDASCFGVPQRRRRLFLLGRLHGETPVQYPESLTSPADAHDEPTTLFSVDRPFGPSVDDALRDLPNLDRFTELLEGDRVRLSSHELASIKLKASLYVRRLRGEISDRTNFSYKRAWDRRDLTSSTRTDHTALSIRRFHSTLPGTVEPISRFLRLPAAGLCNTLRAGTSSERGAYTSPRPIHPLWPRVISVREAARLHSFPDWFRFHHTKWHGFRQVGNSVPPLLGRAVAAEVRTALGVTIKRPRKVIPLGDEKLLYMNMSHAAAHFSVDAATLPQRTRRSPRPS